MDYPNSSPSSNAASLPKKIVFAFFILVSQFLFLILVSYTGEGTHFLGENIYSLVSFLVADFLGISLFIIAFYCFWLGFKGLRGGLKLTSFLHQAFFTFLLFFFIQILLLNTSFINTQWSGLIPRFAHALILHFLSTSSNANFLSFSFEVALVLFAFFLTLKSYDLKMSKSIAYLKEVLFKNLTSVQKKSQNHFAGLKQKLSSIIKPIDIENLDEEMKEKIKNNFISPLEETPEPSPVEEKLKQRDEANELITLPKDDELTRQSTDQAVSQVVEQAVDWKVKLEKENQPFLPQESPDEVIDLTKIDLTRGDLFFSKKINSPDREISKAKNIAANSPEEETIPETITKAGDPFTEGDSSMSRDLIINQNINPLVLSYLADGTKLNFNLNKKIDNLATKREIEQNIVKLEKTIKEFGIISKVVNVSIGPAITQYEMTLEPGVRISKVISLTDNIALSLGAKSVRVVAPIPGKTVIGIEIPNQNQEKIYLRDIIEKKEFLQSKAHLPIALGASITGKGVIADLTTTPHLLVAGATGSGKSVCINSIICSLLLKLSPYQVRFLMVDPKMVELTIYNGIPHLLAPVITHYKQAAIALKWVIREMENRYALLEKNSVRSISSYNEIVSHRNIALNNPKDNPNDNLKENTMPYIVIVIDEFADLMMVGRKEIEDSITRLAAMSRAVGIHLILATQRPSVDVITGIIKANFPSRIAFQVSSKIDSRTILDLSGAEKLLGRGDMLLQSNSSNVLKRIQGTFLADAEVAKIIAELKQQPSITKDIDFSLENSQRSDKRLEKQADPFYQEALKILWKEEKISTSFLQRKLKIGYNRAARIVETFEEQGIISPADGVKPRELLKTK